MKTAAPASTLFAPLTAWWARLPARERRLLLLAAAVALGGLLWALAIAPALATLKKADSQRARLHAQWQHMQTLQAQAQTLQGLPRITQAQSQQALQEATRQTLGDSARLQISGDSATLTLQNAPAEQLAQWLHQARINARALPAQARLTRAGADSAPGKPHDAARWSGSLTLTLPPA